MTPGALPAIPPPLEHDPEDVFWALSTATTLWSRGEHVEALKWLRRASEQASVRNIPGRSLELAKAVTELTALHALALEGGAPPRTPPAPPAVPPMTAVSRALPPLPSRPPPPPPIPQRLALGQSARAATPAPPAVQAPRPAAVPARPPPPPSAPAAPPPSAPPSVAPPRPASVLPPPPPRAAPSIRPPPPPPPARTPASAAPPAPPPPPASAPARAPITLSAPSAPPKARVTRDARENKITSSNRRVSTTSAKRVDRMPDTPVEDLDDPTNVLDGKRTTQSRAAARKPAEPVKARKASTSQVDELFETLVGIAPAAAPTPAPPGPEPPPPPVAAPAPAPVPVPAPPAAVPSPASAPAAPAPAPRPAMSGLLAQRVIVVLGRDGEARIVAAAGLTSVPDGAIAAIVVPLAAVDGEPLARLLRGRATE